MAVAVVLLSFEDPAQDVTVNTANTDTERMILYAIYRQMDE